MKVFITGGTGFIGTPLTKALLRRGHEVTLLSRSGKSIEGVKIAKGDVTEKETMRDGMTGADIVFHNAGWYELGVSEESKRRMQAINVEGTKNVLSLAKELGIKRVVYTSSCVAIGDTGGVTGVTGSSDSTGFGMASASYSSAGRTSGSTRPSRTDLKA